MFNYLVHMESLGKSHDFGPYRTARKAHEVFDLVSEIAPADAVVTIVMKENKDA